MTTTAATRRIERGSEPIGPSVPGADGRAGRWGRPVTREGDEGSGGRVVDLVEKAVVTVDLPPR